MAGRGRGRGRGGLGLSMDPGMRSEPAAVPLLVPPPHYPPLEYRPLPTTMTTELRYLLQLKKGFADHMHESPNNVLPKVVKKDIDRYSDRYKESSRVRYDARYDWTRMPAELKVVTKRVKGDQSEEVKAKKQKVVDINAKLEELESKEAISQSDNEEEDKEEEDEEDKDEDLAEEEEDSDEEMDDGTDYVNSYFDNGEDYDDDDDKANDEAVYS